jgi:hypothetical protein
MNPRMVSLLLLATGLFAIAPSRAADNELERVAASCPAAAAWISAHRSPHADKRDADHTFSSPGLRTALRQHADGDQRARDAWMASGLRTDSKEAEASRQVDASNTAWLKREIARSGFPTPAQVGTQGVGDAWLLVQHADGDPAFQAKVLGMLEPRVSDGSIPASDYAMLVDRVRINQGKPQRYGTQFANNPGESGGMRLSPVEDEAHLDERRAGMGLMPLRDYECALRATYLVGPAQK